MKPIAFITLTWFFVASTLAHAQAPPREQLPRPVSVAAIPGVVAAQGRRVIENMNGRRWHGSVSHALIAPNLHEVKGPRQMS